MGKKANGQPEAILWNFVKTHSLRYLYGWSHSQMFSMALAFLSTYRVTFIIINHMIKTVFETAELFYPRQAQVVFRAT